MASTGSTRYHLAYLTANDQRDFSVDYLHFRNLARQSPGVAHVEITIAISRVRPFSPANFRQIEALVKCAAASPWLSVRTVIWKGNIGRDFSSARASLQSIGETASANDYVMVRNRSAYGPLTDSWYQAYVEQYERHPGTGLVGSTINLSGPPTLPEDEDGRHVQTYVYLSQWRHLEALIDDFPGCQCTDNPGAILHGEIGLSRQMMARGFKLSCLYWPEHAFGMTSHDDASLPHEDIKGTVTGLPFLYKFPAYRRSRGPFLRRLAWLSSLAASRLQFNPRTRSRLAGSGIRHVQLGEYD